MKAPTRCGNGHPLGPGQVLVHFLPCTCAGVRPTSNGHMMWTCRTCKDQVVPECVDRSLCGRDYRPR